MSRPPLRPTAPRSATEPPVRRGVWVIIFLLTLTTVAAIWMASRKRPTTQPVTDSNPPEPPAVQTANTQHPAPAHGLIRSKIAVSKPGTILNPGFTPKPSGAQPTAEARELVARLLRTGDLSASPGAAQVAEWSRDFQLLLQQGDAGVAAVREILATGSNYDFGDWGRTNLGYASSRFALFDALAKTGTPDARLALAETLQSTLEPAEIGTVLRHLETLSPGQYREQALQAAQQTIAAAERGSLPGRDIASAFEILQKYGGPETVPQLNRLSEKYVYYSTMALAQLPDDAGLPLLISMAQGEGDRSFAVKLAAQQMLATLAPDHPAAFDALLDNVRSNLIAPSGWKFVAAALEGKNFSYENGTLNPPAATTNTNDLYRAHLIPGNQHYLQAVPPTALTPDWASQQIGLVDQLLAVTRNADAVAQLQRVRGLLQTRQQGTGTPPGSP